MSEPATGAGASGPARIGWIVDVQEDFMNPDGRLYVRDLFDDSDPGAVRIIPALEAGAAWMRALEFVVIGVARWRAGRGGGGW